MQTANGRRARNKERCTNNFRPSDDLNNREHIEGPSISLPHRPGPSESGAIADGVSSEHAQAIEQYLGENPRLGKASLVQLLVRRFSTLSSDDAWIAVARYFNNKA
jgi:hypothetical protein